MTARSLLHFRRISQREPLRGNWWRESRAATHLSLFGVSNRSRLGSRLDVDAIVPAARETRKACLSAGTGAPPVVRSGTK